MYIKQLYTNCLAEAAYYIESEGEAVIIDPLRETEPYLELARERNAEIKYIFETHFHADFVSGHIDLSQKTGAPIVFGPGAETSYEITQATDGQEFKLGKLTIRLLHTPGHTPESSCYLLLDESKTPKAIFTGDTLFIGDVGRPDLAQKDGSMTAEDMASTLYDSLREKIMPLPDDVVVYPAHGAGSACGKNMSKETFDTLGNQKKSNYALSDLSKEEFVKELTVGILPPPAYFAQAASINKAGYDSLEELYKNSLVGLEPQAFLKIAQKEQALVIDTRNQNDFRTAHIPGSWFIGLNGQFAPWAGTVIPSVKQPLLIVADEGKEQEAVMRLARVGFSNVKGFLKGGLDAWKASQLPTAQLDSISAEELVKNQAGKTIIDVRRPGEFEAGHLPGAHNAPLDFFEEEYLRFGANHVYHLHCQGGYRSVIAASILKSRGIQGVVDVMGGYAGLVKAGAQVVTSQPA